MKKETSENKKERTNENTIIIVQSYMEGDKERLSGTYLFSSTYINQSGCDLICSLTAETYFKLSLNILSYQIISNQMIGKG